jgi:DnaJ-class molecular chaperone
MLTDKEMQRALRADGKKLRQLTGADHGPEFWLTCSDCFGEGSHEVSKPQHDDPHFAISVRCETCNGVGLILKK